MRVFAKDFMNAHLAKQDPYVLPEDCNQVFLVDDRLHRYWKIVVDTEVRKTRVYDNNRQAGVVEEGPASEPADESAEERNIVIEENEDSDDEPLAGPSGECNAGDGNTWEDEDLIEEEYRVHSCRRGKEVSNHTFDAMQEQELLDDESNPLDVSDGEHEVEFVETVRDPDHEVLEV
ncbi:hypothetical protein KC19_VG312700 [Ceratodon purpureus]|uniref:DUF4216 domain-containing protein n=1 Tax=Ceratodon purpureus TaxID=3225 RepID=A0A8T0HVF4_CERPU|nr:hypothetical protein KC19_VG312700 [Ceratodon purpureus]